MTASVDAVEFAIQRESDVARAAVAVASSPRHLPAFPLDERGVIGTVVSELAKNIIKYAGGGTIRIQPLLQDGKPGVCVQAIDHGPGIADVEAALRDGYSTGGTLGLGLPAVRRLMDTLDIQCPEGGGTRVEAVRWLRRPLATPPSPRAAVPVQREARAGSRPPLQLRVETRERPYRSRPTCGDRTWFQEADAYALLALLDGTGHSLAAHEAADTLVRTIEARVKQWPQAPDPSLLLHLLDECHQAARHTVGAAITLALVDRAGAALHHVGIGNTCIMVFSPSGWEGVSREGVIGLRYRPPLLGSQPLRAGDTVVVFSDGLSSSKVRQMRRRSNRPTEPAAIADLLMSTAKPDDDASCLVVTCS